MSSTGLDLPLLPSAEQIRRRVFARVRRGFDPDQVHDYLLQIADQIETLEEEVREARLVSEQAPSQPAPVQRDPIGEMADRIADIVRTAERHAQERRAEIEEESRTILAEARAEADRIRLDAQSRAEEVRQEGSDMLARARAEADRALGSLSSRRQDLVEQFRAMRERLLGIAGDLGTVVEREDEEEESDGAEARGVAGLFSPGRSRERSGGGTALWTSTDTVNLNIPDLSPAGSDEELETREG
ncbi:MAG: DivIVA domain-containing protein [Actinomycetota bacterium]|nr:DivIVA domain-containing protein [Actinomycetota bacterium]